METLLATERLIDSVWTLEYFLNSDGTVTIDSYNRTNKVGYEQEKTVPRMSLQEDGNRTVTGVWIEPYKAGSYWANKETATLHKVTNPKYIFDYKTGSAYTFYEMRKKESDDSEKVLRSYGERVLIGTPYGKWFNRNLDKLSPLNQHFVEQLIDGVERHKKEGGL